VADLNGHDGARRAPSPSLVAQASARSRAARSVGPPCVASTSSTGPDRWSNKGFPLLEARYLWPREESNLRTRIRSPSLYPLSYGAWFTRGGGRDLNPRPPGPQPGALPTELPPPRVTKDSSGLGLPVCGEEEENRAERHRQAEKPDRSELDRTGLTDPGLRFDRRGPRRRSQGEVDASHPGDLGRRDQDELRTERACQRGRSGGIHARSILRLRAARGIPQKSDAD
jgi:hypothetical protein